MFDSKKEANRYCELKLMERAGEITDLRRQVRYEPPCESDKTAADKAADIADKYADFLQEREENKQ